MRKVIIVWVNVLFMVASFGLANAARDYINIVGSSTVYPFATVVAEQFGKSSSYKTPKIESTGSGGGFKLFCAGVGVEHPDITNSSRAIKKSEFDTCAANGVKEIVEVKIGYDGIVLANSKKAAPLKLTCKDIFLALAKDVPDPSGAEKLVPNPYKTWQDVNPLGSICRSSMPWRVPMWKARGAVCVKTSITRATRLKSRSRAPSWPPTIGGVVATERPRESVQSLRQMVCRHG